MNRISVAMCTCNGARYVADQLHSILEQQRLVDEIVICDDCSTDGTLDLLHAVVNRAQVPIRVVQNATQQGFIRNFAQAISLCTGEVIFLADQDDVWLPTKVREVMQVFDSHPEIDVVSTDATLMDELGQSLGTETLWQVTRMDYYDYFREQNLLPVFFAASGRVTGATMAFRNKPPYNEFLKYQADFRYHDETLSFMALAVNRYYPLSKPSMHYRLSSSQSCGLPRQIFDRDLCKPWPWIDNFLTLPMSESWQSHIAFLAERLTFGNHPLGIVTHWSRYAELYGRYASSFRRADFLRAWQAIRHRLHLVDHGEWNGRSCRYEGGSFRW